MIQDKSVNQEQGFTMLEIVTVLVLLGIISAVAVPKFFDMQGVSEEKAAKAALAEAQVRINAGYSKAVYAGKSCEDAVATVDTLGKIANKDGDDLYLGQFKVVSPSKDTVFSPNGTQVTIQLSNGTQTATLTVPSCESESGGSSGESGIVCPDSSSKPNLCLGSVQTKCNGTVTCTCTEAGMSCDCVSDSITPDGSEEENKIVRPGKEYFEKNIVPFKWDERKSYPGGFGLIEGNVVKFGSDYYVMATQNSFRPEEYNKGLDATKYVAHNASELGDERFLIKVDFDNSNWVYLSESVSAAEPWIVYKNGKWQNSGAVKFGNITYINDTLYVARIDTAGTYDPLWNTWAWVKVTTLKFSWK